jgi:uncharacterized membrane protein YbhN (UPF0104 family)
MHPRLKGRLRYGISLALAVVILALLVWKQDWRTLVENMAEARVWPLLGAAAVAGAYWALRVRRWRWMTSIERTEITARRAWLSMLAGLGIGLVTPMRSGEVVRAAFVPQGARLRLASWIIIERVFDLSAVLTLCAAGVVYMALGGRIGQRTIPPWMLLAVPPLLAAALGAPLLVRYRPRRVWSLMLRLLPGKIRALARIRLGWRQFGVFYVYSVGSAILSVLAVFMCLRAYGHDHRIGLLPAMMLTPFVMLNNLLPVTPGGFGVREAFAVSVFGAFGYKEEMVFAAYVANAVIVLVAPGAAGVMWAWASGVASQLTEAGRLTDADADLDSPDAAP